MKRIERVIVSNANGLQTSRLPDNEEIMNKINEIVDWINSNEKLLDKNPFTTANKERR